MSLDSGYGIDVSSTHIYYADFFRGLGKFEKSNSTYDVLLYANNPVIAVKIFKPEGSSILVSHSLQSTVNWMMRILIASNYYKKKQYQSKA